MACSQPGGDEQGRQQEGLSFPAWEPWEAAGGDEIVPGLFLLPSPGVLWPPSLSHSQGLGEHWEEAPRSPQEPRAAGARGHDGDRREYGVSFRVQPSQIQSPSCPSFSPTSLTPELLDLLHRLPRGLGEGCEAHEHWSPPQVAVPDVVQAAADADILIFVVPHQFISKICGQLKGHLKANAIGVSLIKVPEISPCGWGGCS